MRTVDDIAAVRDAVRAARARSARVGVVPTMGFLHDGHLALVDEARRRADFVVMSIFVNPLQFGPTEDLARYPRDLDGDSRKAMARGVDLLFVPAPAVMYPREPEVRVVPRTLDQRWEGELRPGHFAGVLTVVAKLFNIVQPDVAVFGQKDVQQATLIRAMVRDLDFPVDVVVAPTVREPDGLAMSSRNSYLDAAARERATLLSRALRAMDDALAAGETSPDALTRRGREVIGADAGIALEYLAVVEPDGLAPAREARPGDVAIVAARLGGTRLIDNLVLGAAVAARAS
jgi:pantoate--beta-alanine ligase